MAKRCFCIEAGEGLQGGQGLGQPQDLFGQAPSNQARVNPWPSTPVRGGLGGASAWGPNSRRPEFGQRGVSPFRPSPFLVPSPSVTSRGGRTLPSSLGPSRWEPIRDTVTLGGGQQAQVTMGRRLRTPKGRIEMHRAKA